MRSMEHLIMPTLLATTLAGGIGVYAIGAEANDKTAADVARAQEELAIADERVNENFDALPACTQTVLGTLIEVDYESWKFSESATPVVAAQCGNEAENNFLQDYFNSRENAEKLSNTVEAVKSRSEFDLGEKAQALTFGAAVGFAAGMFSLYSVAIIADKIKTRKSGKLDDTVTTSV